MAVAEDILKDPYFADLDIDLSQFSEEEKTVILGVMQKAKVRIGKSLRSCLVFLSFPLVNSAFRSILLASLIRIVDKCEFVSVVKNLFLFSYPLCFFVS